VIDFFGNVDKIAKAKKWDDEERLDWVPLLLDGPASLFYDQLLDSVKQDYGQLRRAFVDKFNGNDEKNRRIMQLHNIQQRDGEDVLNFYTRICNLAKGAYDGLGFDQLQPLLMNHFLHGVKGNIKRQVILAGPDTVDHALAIAHRVENNLDL
jgi:hypothetical protein